MLKVTVAEVQREVMKQLGVNLSGTVGSGSSVFTFVNNTPFPVTGQPLVAGNALTAQLNGINATLRAMERAGVIRTLAEPTLTAISGESANFLAGGEFPVQGGVNCTGERDFAELHAAEFCGKNSASVWALRRSCCRKAASA